MYPTSTKPFSLRPFRRNSIKKLFLSCPVPYITNSAALTQYCFSVCCLRPQKHNGKTVWDLLLNAHEYELGRKMHTHTYILYESCFYQISSYIETYSDLLSRHVYWTKHNFYHARIQVVYTGWFQMPDTSSLHTVQEKNKTKTITNKEMTNKTQNQTQTNNNNNKKTQKINKQQQTITSNKSTLATPNSFLNW